MTAPALLASLLLAAAPPAESVPRREASQSVSPNSRVPRSESAKGVVTNSPAPSPQQPAAADRTNPRIPQLVAQLGADSYLDREAASRALREIGEPARAALQQAASAPDLELRLRATALVDELRQADLWQPTRVNLAAQNVPTSQVLQQIARDTGNAITFNGPLGPLRDVPITVAFKDTPFWQAIDEVCRQSGNQLRPVFDRTARGLFISEGPASHSPVAYAGPLRVSVASIRRSFVEDFEFERRTSRLNQDLQLTLQLVWEDRLRLVAYSYQLQNVQVLTNTGETLTATTRYGRNWGSVLASVRQVAFSLALSPPSSDPEKLDELSFSLRLAAVGNTRTLTLDPLVEAATASQDSWDVTVERINHARSGWDIALVVNSPAPPADRQRLGPYESRFQAYDAVGRALRLDNQANQFAGASLRYIVRFSAAAGQGPPAKLVMTYPLMRTTRDIEVRFRDVPLPAGRPK